MGSRVHVDSIERVHSLLVSFWICGLSEQIINAHTIEIC